MRQPHHRSGQVWHALSKDLTVLPATDVPEQYEPDEAGPHFTDPGGMEG